MNEMIASFLINSGYSLVLSKATGFSRRGTYPDWKFYTHNSIVRLMLRMNNSPLKCRDWND